MKRRPFLSALLAFFFPTAAPAPYVFRIAGFAGSAGPAGIPILGPGVLVFYDSVSPTWSFPDGDVRWRLRLLGRSSRG
jgi:hypothetical protein